MRASILETLQSPPRLPGAARRLPPGWHALAQGRHTKTAAACVLLQLILLVAVYQVHELLMGPSLAQVRQPARLLAEAGDNATLPRALGPAGTGCGVALADADRELLRREVDGIMRSLADKAPWVGAAAEAADAKGAAGQIRGGEALAVAGTQALRLSDEPWGGALSGASNTPGTQDVHAELAAYAKSLVRAMVTDSPSAAKRQARSRAAELGLVPWDDLRDLDSLPTRVAFLNQLHKEVAAREALRVCVVTTTSADVHGVRSELLPWMQYHTELGVTHFYVVYDGHDAEAVKLLQQVAHLTLIHLHDPFASTLELQEYDMYAKQARAKAVAASAPGNFQLMEKQGYGEHVALQRAREAGMHWLLHIDADELFHPGGGAFSITEVLGRVPPHCPSMRFMNFEGQPEAGDLTNRYEQVTLFRVHKHFITPEALFYRPKYKLGDNSAYLMLYANGKAAVRVDAPGVRHAGPHFFTGDPSPRWQTSDNPKGEWLNLVSDDSAILHYAYSYPGDVSSKAHRSCPDSYLDGARRGDRNKIKECFVLELDQDAYIAAAQGPRAVEDFFFSRMVLSEGSRVRCQDPANGLQGWCTLTDIGRFKHLMEKVGLLRRVLGPQILLRQHERAIRAMAQRGGSTKA